LLLDEGINVFQDFNGANLMSKDTGS